MSHDHHSTHHEHPHHHDHSTRAGGREPAADQKLAMILEHWIKHNESHVSAYREWAQKAAELSLHDAGARIDEAADLTLAANRKFEEALRKVRQRG
jgi:hypothetical protein